jgi:competence protein ComEA
MLGWLERNQLLVLGLVCIVLAAGLAVRGLRADPSGELVFVDEPLPNEGTPIRVQIAGAVVSPGVYELRSGDRLIDILAAAGGPRDGAALDELNLAHRLRDAEKITIPSHTMPRAQRAQPLAPGSKLDLNVASQDQLDALPGVGEAYARRIVDSRQVDGPFQTPRELVDRRVLPASTFERIREMVFVFGQ